MEDELHVVMEKAQGRGRPFGYRVLPVRDPEEEGGVGPSGVGPHHLSGGDGVMPKNEARHS